MKKKQLFIFPNSLTIHQTSALHNTFYFNNTWMKILWSDPVNMQPDKTKCCPQRPITILWPAVSKMPSTSSRSAPSEHRDIIINNGERLQDSDGGCRVLECHIIHHKVACMSWCFQANIWLRKDKMWWLIEICINCAVNRSFDGYQELSGD